MDMNEPGYTNEPNATPQRFWLNSALVDRALAISSLAGALYLLLARLAVGGGQLPIDLDALSFRLCCRREALVLALVQLQAAGVLVLTPPEQPGVCTCSVTLFERVPNPLEQCALSQQRWPTARSAQDLGLTPRWQVDQEGLRRAPHDDAAKRWWREIVASLSTSRTETVARPTLRSRQRGRR